MILMLSARLYLHATSPGAPFQWCAVFHKSDLQFTKGTEGLSFYSSQDKSRDYQLPTKVACAHCRSPILDEGKNVCLIFPELIDYEVSGSDHETWRKTFESRYVLISWALLGILWDEILIRMAGCISSILLVQWISRTVSPSGRGWQHLINS